MDFLFWLSCWHRHLMHSPENNPACCAAYRARSFGTMSRNTLPLSRSRGLAARAQQKQRSSPPALFEGHAHTHGTKRTERRAELKQWSLVRGGVLLARLNPHEIGVVYTARHASKCPSAHSRRRRAAPSPL